MKIHFTSIALGFVLSCALFVLVIALFLFSFQTNTQVFRDLDLASGKKIQVTAFHLAWGIDHNDRYLTQDAFQLDYVTSSLNQNQTLLHQEIHEIFEMIRPIAESWHVNNIIISAFPTLQRKGKYEMFHFKQTKDSKWTYEQKTEKVFIND